MKLILSQFIYIAPNSENYTRIITFETVKSFCRGNTVKRERERHRLYSARVTVWPSHYFAGVWSSNPTYSSNRGSMRPELTLSPLSNVLPLPFPTDRPLVSRNRVSNYLVRSSDWKAKNIRQRRDKGRGERQREKGESSWGDRQKVAEVRRGEDSKSREEIGVYRQDSNG